MAGTIKFYTDEHIHGAVVRGLRQRGVDVLTFVEAGRAGAPDQDQLLFAKAEGRVIYTNDEDFLHLAATVPDHAGIVYTRQQTPIGTVLNGLMLIHGVLEAHEMIGRVEYL